MENKTIYFRHRKNHSCFVTGMSKFSRVGVCATWSRWLQCSWAIEKIHLRYYFFILPPPPPTPQKRPEDGLSTKRSIVPRLILLVYSVNLSSETLQTFGKPCLTFGFPRPGFLQAFQSENWLSGSVFGCPRKPVFLHPEKYLYTSQFDFLHTLGWVK